MRRFVTILLLCLSAAVPLMAQNASGEPGADSFEYRPAAQVDSTLLRTGLYASMPANVTLRQSSAIRDAFISMSKRNRETAMFTGFRIKLYSDSSQAAREESETVYHNFREWYPGISVYRTYTSPNFKVIAGDFRTRVDAEKALRVIRQSFPAATIIKEKMQYPTLDEGVRFVADTLTVVTPKKK